MSQFFFLSKDKKGVARLHKTNEGFKKGTTGPPGAPSRPANRAGEETLNPPPPSGGERKVGYPGARGGRPGAKPPHRAGVTGSGGDRGPVHRTGLVCPAIPPCRAAPTSSPPLRQPSELSGTGRRVAPPSRGGKREPRPIGTRSGLWVGCSGTPDRRIAGVNPRRRTERGGPRASGGKPNPTSPGRGREKKTPLGIRRQLCLARPCTGQARARPVMILPQVHLRKPCYDFYFL